MKLYSVLKPI